MYQGIVKATVSRIFEDLKFKMSDGSDDSAQLAGQIQDNFNFGPSLLNLRSSNTQETVAFTIP